MRELLRRHAAGIFSALAVLLAAIAVAIDFSTWIELNVSIIYGLPLVVATAARSRRLLWTLALVCVSATFIVYFLQIPPGVFGIHEPYFIDRLLAAANVIVIAGLLHALSLATDALAARNAQLSVYQQEITRRNQELDLQRAQAEEASDRKTRLLMSVSHDIRTPLTTINLMAELIRDTAANPDLLAKLPSLVHNLQTNALSLADMVTDVLDIAYFDSGRIELRESEFPLNEVIAEECRWLEPLAAAKGLTLIHESAAPAAWLCADRVKLARVLRNLISNAIQFTARGGVTVSSALTPARGLLICVIDTGAGIAQENLESIFGDFTHLRSLRARSSQPVESGGWGLGLAICRRLTALMGGEISVESQPDRGSVFKVHLPPSRVLQRTFVQ